MQDNLDWAFLFAVFCILCVIILIVLDVFFSSLLLRRTLFGILIRLFFFLFCIYDGLICILYTIFCFSICLRLFSILILLIHFLCNILRQMPLHICRCLTQHTCTIIIRCKHIFQQGSFAQLCSKHTVFPGFRQISSHIVHDTGAHFILIKLIPTICTIQIQ